MAFGPAAVPPLLHALNTVGRGLQGYVIEVLGHTGDERALSPLLAILDQDEEYTSGMACAVLSYLGAATVPPLIERIKTHPNLSVRHNAMRAISHIDDPRVEAIALEELHTPELQALALNILGNSHGVADMQQRIDLIAAYLDNPNEWTRTSAILALGRLGDDRAVDLLLAQLDVPDIVIPANTISALTRIASPRVVEALMKLLDTPLVDLAVEALGQIGDKRAVAPIAALHETTTDKRLRLITQDALIRLEFFPPYYDPTDDF